jgi:hypothetical protein
LLQLIAATSVRKETVLRPGLKIADMPIIQRQFCVARINDTTVLAVGGIDRNPGVQVKML